METPIIYKKHCCYLAELQFCFLGDWDHPPHPVWTGALPPVPSLPPEEFALTTTLQKEKRQEASSGAKREEQQEQEEEGSFESSPARLSSKGCFHRLSSQDSLGEACKTASARVRQPCRKPVEGTPLTPTSALFLAPLTQPTLPLASTLPAEPPSDLTRIPLGPVAMSSTPAHSCWPFLNSGLGHMSCRIEFLSRWNIIKVLFFPMSSHFESQQGHLFCHRPVPSFWGGPANREGETDSTSVANPDVQKLLETEITERIQTKVWGKEEQGDPGTPQMLEAHSIMSGLNFCWGLPLLSLEPADLKACEAQHSALPLSPFPPAATCGSGAHSKADFAQFMGKPLEPPPGDKVLTLTTEASVPSLPHPLPAPSPVCEENQKALGGTLPGDGSEPSEASLLGQEGRLPSPTFTFRLSERKGQSWTIKGAEQGCLELSSGCPVARNEPREESRCGASPEPCRGVATLEGESGSQSWT
ncbi:uncharacterized protein [Equus caballus]|uniref:uncharacterized protein isoform X1 n=1 Tax=Equus caballus TaxID=9796 RepID=UPI0038B355A7